MCTKHGGSAPQTVAAARRRLLAAAEPLMANLIKIATSSDDEALRLRATMDALTRAGITERGTVQVEVTHSFDDVLAGIVDDAVKDRRERGALSPSAPASVRERSAPIADEAGGGVGSDARDAAELQAVDAMHAESALSARDQEAVAAAGGGSPPWGVGARPDERGVYTVTSLHGDYGQPTDDPDWLPPYLRDPDAAGRADLS